MNLTIKSGFLTSLPEGCWAEGPGIRLWLASLVPIGRNFERVFWERGRQPEFYRLPSMLAIGEAIEFGCDRVTTNAVVSAPGAPGGVRLERLEQPEREKRRTYAYIVGRNKKGIEIEVCESADDAIKRGKTFCRRHGHSLPGVNQRDLEAIKSEWLKLTADQKASFILATFGGIGETPDGLAGAMADWILENRL